MLELVIGSKDKLAVNKLISELEDISLDGTLYVGYPILETMDDPIFTDAMLISKQYGLVIFDLEENDPNSANFWDILEERQDDLHSAVTQKLLSYKPLRKRRDLAVDIIVITYLPYDVSLPPDKGVLVAGPGRLQNVLSDSPIEDEYIKPLNAAIQRVTNLKPRKKRSSVKRSDSRGAILKQIEKEIANLDRWQNHAAIESPDGAQRIRGLAGSGKTIVLALKAAYLHTRHPEWNIALTFYTRSLYQQFKDLVRRFTFEHTKDEPDWAKLKILHSWGGYNQPGVYFEIAANHGVEPRDFDYGKQEYGWDNAFQGVCQELLDSIQQRGASPLYDAILIDEAQDFPKSFFQLAYQAVVDPKRIVWAYDELQNLSDFRMAHPEELFGVDSQGRSLITLSNQDHQARQDIVLPICYRNTPWALATAHALGFGIYREKSLVQYFDDPDLWNKMGYEVLGGHNAPGKEVILNRRKDATPQYFQELLKPPDAVQCKVFENQKEQAAWVAEEIKENLEKDELEFSDILIILPNAYTSRSEAAVIRNTLQENGINAHLAGVTSSKDELFLDDSIAIAHIHRAKGNEAPMVYILNSQYGFEGAELIKRRNALFTAITRSRAWVRICGCGSAMQDLKTEIDQIVKKDFKLEFTVPRPKELAAMRKIHRDMTKDEQADIRRIEQTLAKYIEGVEKGYMGKEIISRQLRDKLRDLLEST
jgi:superfamily I DNA and RNA helicase